MSGLLNLISEDSALAVSLNYDYSLIDEEHREKARNAAVDIKRRERRAATEIVEIGRSLKDVRDRLEYGQFGEWIEAEFGWRKTMAYTFINVAEGLPKFGKVEAYGLSALYLLSAPSVPDEVIEEANQIAASGQRVTHGVAKALIAAAKPPKPETPAELADRYRADAAAIRQVAAQPKPAQAASHPTPFDLPAVLQSAGWLGWHTDNEYWCVHRKLQIATSTHETPAAAIAAVYEKISVVTDGQRQAAAQPSTAEDEARAWLVAGDWGFIERDGKIKLFPHGDGPAIGEFRTMQQAVEAAVGYKQRQATARPLDAAETEAVIFRVLERSAEGEADRRRWLLLHTHRDDYRHALTVPGREIDHALFLAAHQRALAHYPLPGSLEQWGLTMPGEPPATSARNAELTAAIAALRSAVDILPVAERYGLYTAASEAKRVLGELIEGLRGNLV